MHAVIITFHSTASLSDVHDDFLAGADPIANVPGLLSKTWLQDGDRLGGFYIFTDAAAAQDYLAGPIIAETRAVPVFSDWEVREFTVLEEFSVITRGVPAAASSPAG